ncbi:hypothetical protein M8J76_001887 [Diaphorina citri]|nr:hypothetical protein M8J76_001887 [Diaphorina citri]
MSVNNEVSPLIPFLGKKSQLQPPDFLPTHGSRQGIKITLNQVDSIGGKTKHSGLDQCESLAKVDSAINYCLTNRYKTFLSHFDLAAVQSAVIITDLSIPTRGHQLRSTTCLTT